MNKQTIGQKLRAYRRRPGSLILMLLVMLSAGGNFCSSLIFDCIHFDQRTSASDTRSVCIKIYFRKCIFDAGAVKYNRNDCVIACNCSTAWDFCRDLFL